MISWPPEAEDDEDEDDDDADIAETNTAETLSVASERTCMGFDDWLFVSQIRTVASKLPEMTTEPSLLLLGTPPPPLPPKLTQLMRPKWPVHRRRVRAVLTSQRKTVLSPPTEAKRSLDGVRARSRTS